MISVQVTSLVLPAHEMSWTAPIMGKNMLPKDIFFYFNSPLFSNVMFGLFAPSLFTLKNA